MGKGLSKNKSLLSGRNGYFLQLDIWKCTNTEGHMAQKICEEIDQQIPKR